MKYSLVVIAAALAAFTLSACDRQQAAAPAPPATVVTVPVPGPAGPPGAPGMTGGEGAKGEPGKTGGDTIIVVPPSAPPR